MKQAEKVIRHVFSAEVPQEKSHDFSGEGGAIDQRLTHMLYHLADNRHYIKGILSRESGELFMGYLKERLSKVFTEYLKPTLDIVPD